VDMRLDFERAEIWIEAKTWSEEGGASSGAKPVLGDVPTAEAALAAPEIRRQLDLYWEVIRATCPDSRCCALVLLRPTRLGRNDVPLLSWAAIRSVVRGNHDASRAWDELVQFLEESHVVDDELDPVKAAEAASLTPMAGLYRKAAGVIWRRSTGASSTTTVRRGGSSRSRTGSLAGVPQGS
jgi:hypothetical protein